MQKYFRCEHCNSIIPAENFYIEPNKIHVENNLDILGNPFVEHYADVQCPVCNKDNRIESYDWTGCNIIEPDDCQVIH